MPVPLIVPVLTTTGEAPMMPAAAGLAAGAVAAALEFVGAE
jgi:hypothetical protein